MALSFLCKLPTGSIWFDTIDPSTHLLLLCPAALFPFVPPPHSPHFLSIPLWLVAKGYFLFVVVFILFFEIGSFVD